MSLQPLNPSIPIDAFNQAELFIHHASQFMAMLGKNYVEQQPDDSNTNLAWNPANESIESRRIDLHYLRLHIPSFSLQWMDDESKSSEWLLDGQTKSSTFDWVKEQLEDHGQDSSKLKYVDHYEVPPHPVDDGAAFLKPDDELLSEWMKQRNNANNMLAKLNEVVGQESEIRIWPHHYDTGTYYAFGDTKAIGAGWAIADTLRKAPYLYIYPWEKDRVIDFNEANPLTNGNWLSGEWTGAILDLADLSNADNPDLVAETFINEVINHYKTLLSIS